MFIRRFQHSGLVFGHSSGFSPGFTLAELLIALAILGVIATFTIPKILVSQQNAKYNAIAHETMSMISAAYQLYQTNNGPVSASTSMNAFTQYMNYVSVDTSSNVDNIPGSGNLSCTGGSGNNCLVLHNGARLLMVSGWTFGGTTSTNIIQAWIDPDGVDGGTTNGPGKSVAVELYYNGKITTYGSVGNTFCGSWACPFSATSGNDPSWFSW